MKFEVWINNKRQEETFESRDAANVYGANRRGHDQSMKIEVCREGTGRLDGTPPNVKLVIDRDADRRQGNPQPQPQQALAVMVQPQLQPQPSQPPSARK